MTFLIVLITIFLVMDCLLLGLLILIQLPKKEAGVGVAFGGGATDALFGAGSGTALTKLTKYTAGIFFAVVFLLAVLNIRAGKTSIHQLRQELSKETAAATTAPLGAPAAASPAGAAAASNTAAAAGTNAGAMDLKLPAAGTPAP